MEVDACYMTLSFIRGTVALLLLVCLATRLACVRHARSRADSAETMTETYVSEVPRHERGPV